MFPNYIAWHDGDVEVVRLSEKHLVFLPDKALEVVEVFQELVLDFEEAAYFLIVLHAREILQELVLRLQEGLAYFDASLKIAQ